MEEEECLVSRRQKRSTAGNRMELALAELALEEPQEPEEDVDFVVEKEEEDIFESDFASTDEEVAREDVDEGDTAVREEERRERKTARARIEKATAVAHARQRVTFNPEATSSQPKSKPFQKVKRRVSLGAVVNAETGEVIEGSTGTVGIKRHSQRRHTVLNTSATVNRIKNAEEKRAAIPKKTKIATRLPTQDELIARALDTEEGNITEHRNYLRLEEEKRAKARVVKQSIDGPVLRWISKKEIVQVEVQPPPPPPTTTAVHPNVYANYGFVYTAGVGPGTIGSQAYSTPFYAYAPLTMRSAAPKPQEASVSVSATTSSSYLGARPEEPSADPSITVPAPMSHSTSLPSDASSNVWDSITPATPTASSAPSVQTQPLAQPEPPLVPSSASVPTTPTATISYRNEDVCKNYVIHELSQSIPSKPTWKETMTAMFGDHVQWDEVKVFTSKGRPLAWPVRTCPITGQPARYRDPRTNVPFANIGAYDVLTKVLGRGYVWCNALGCYVGAGETSRGRRGPDGEVEGPGSGSGTGTGVVEVGEENGTEEAEEAEDRTAKRRKVEITDG